MRSSWPVVHPRNMKRPAFLRFSNSCDKESVKLKLIPDDEDLGYGDLTIFQLKSTTFVFFDLDGLYRIKFPLFQRGMLVCWKAVMANQNAHFGSAWKSMNRMSPFSILF